ncbi:BON domain-containing protein [Novosphingobium aquimarinum]|uniref:BON domain-containing protein n=1 Tax=Novosphingobium aquimarinum TaxID=2682494 RepID=UPI0018DC7E5C|nr:BON domain-containing protein [Novosphingobium aquimarinum]
MNNRDREYQNRNYQDRDDGPRQQNQFADHARQSGGDWQGRGSPQMGGSYEGSYESGYGGPQQLDRDRMSYNRSDRNDRSGSWQSQPRGQGRRGGAEQGYEIPTYSASGSQNFGSFTSEDYGGRDSYGAGGGGIGGSSGYGYRPTYDTLGRNRFGGDAARANQGRDYDDWRSYGESRGFLDRAGDEIASWFGDEDAARRREMDHRGRGPSNYTRSDERIREDANDHLTHDWGVDARKISVSVSEGEVTLDGQVDSRQAKRRAEDVVDQISGVRHVQNNLRVETVREGTPSMPASGMGASAAIGDRKNATTDR